MHIASTVFNNTVLDNPEGECPLEVQGEDEVATCENSDVEGEWDGRGSADGRGQSDEGNEGNAGSDSHGSGEGNDAVRNHDNGGGNEGETS